MCKLFGCHGHLVPPRFRYYGASSGMTLPIFFWEGGSVGIRTGLKNMPYASHWSGIAIGSQYLVMDPKERAGHWFLNPLLSLYQLPATQENVAPVVQWSRFPHFKCSFYGYLKSSSRPGIVWFCFVHCILKSQCQCWKSVWWRVDFMLFFICLCRYKMFRKCGETPPSPSLLSTTFFR